MAHMNLQKAPEGRGLCSKALENVLGAMYPLFDTHGILWEASQKSSTTTAAAISAAVVG